MENQRQLVNSTQDFSTNKRTFKKRAGTTDKGKDYEDLMIANLVLQFLSDNDIEDFSVWSNDEKFGAFDDVIVEINSKDKGIEKYAMQLKHISQKTKKLSLASLTSEKKGNFAINKYFKCFQEHKDYISNYNLILFTNLQFTLQKTVQLQIKSANGETFQVEIIKSNEQSKLNTSNDSLCYKFKVVKAETHELTSSLNEYEEFFRHFFLYTNQMNVDDVKNNVYKQFQTMFSCKNTISERYLKFISEWSMREGLKSKLETELVKQIIALYIVSPFIQSLYFTNAEISENEKLLQKTVSNFQITIFKEDCINDAKILFRNVKQEVTKEEIIEANQKFEITTEEINDLEQLTDDHATILLWLMNKCPLIVSENPEFYHAVNLCTKKRFILICENPPKGVPKCWIFKNLSDLEYDEDLQKHIMMNYKCLLLGNKISVADLLQADKSLQSLITTNELLKMTRRPYEIKQTVEEIPIPYITRFLSKNMFYLSYLNTIDDTTLIFISSASSENDVNSLKKYRPIYVDEYLEECCERNFVSNQALHLEEFFSRQIVYVSSKTCYQREFDSICQKNSRMKAFHHFRISRGMLEWIESKNHNITDLELHRGKQEYSASETELWTSKFVNYVNIITGDPGIGKSCLLKNFKNKISSETWSISFSAQDIVSICHNCRDKVFCDDLENFILTLKFPHYSRFDQYIIKFLIRNHKVVFIWDGLDEIVSDDHIRMLTTFIKDFSEKRIVQWLSCRNHLKNKMERIFNVLARTILPYSENQQIYYIQNRLEFVDIDKNTLEDFTTNIKGNSPMSVPNDILRSPLQMYMLTELCRRDIRRYLKLLSHTFLLTDLYYYFIEEKFIFFYSEKVKLDDSQISRLMLTIKNHLRQLEILALNVLFEPEFLRKLNIDWDFEDDNDNGNDCFGFTTSIKTTNGLLIQFAHISYAEYFAATYFSKHKTLHLKEILFHKKYTSVRYFFDMMLAKNSPPHIDVLYRNVTQLKMCKENLHKKDLGGRNVLQLACSWGQGYQLLNFKKDNDIFVLQENEPSVKPETTEYLEMLQYLTKSIDEYQNEDIFNMNALEYAESVNCLFALAVFEDKRKSGYFKTKDDSFNCNCLYYYIKFGQSKYIIFFENYLNRVKTKKGETVLHIACENGYEDVVNLLLNYGLDVNICDFDGQSSLYPAIRLGDLNITKLLLNSGAKTNIFNKEKCTPLFLASYKGHNQIVELLIHFESDVNVCDKYDWTPLHSATFTGYQKVCETLIKHGADLNATEKYGWTPLHTAAYNGHHKIAYLLIKNGVDINARDNYGWTLFYLDTKYEHTDQYLELLAGSEDNVRQTSFYSTYYNLHDRVLEFLYGLNYTTSEKNGWTPLFVASHNGHEKVVDLLVAAGVDLNVCDENGRTALYIACENDRENIVQLLVQHAANFDTSDENGHTQLHMASATGNIKVLKTLIKIGAGVNIPDNDGCTPLHLAAELARDKVVHQLIISNADVNACNDNGFTPLHTAVYKGHTKTVDLLIQNGADLNRSGNNGQTPLYTASRNGHNHVVELLVKFGPDINTKDVDGRTALHSACYNRHNKVVEILLTSGAVVNASTEEGWTPLYITSGKGDDVIVECLIEFGAEVNVFSKTGLTPLHVACKRGHGNVVELLVKSGADINALTKDGQTPLHLASDHGHLGVVEMLIKFGVKQN